MDYATGIVGEKRGVSYQSIREELYVEPHVGCKPIFFSRDQVKRALKRLEQNGLIALVSIEKRLILKCILGRVVN